jgi:hypothetical protein
MCDMSRVKFNGGIVVLRFDHKTNNGKLCVHAWFVYMLCLPPVIVNLSMHGRIVIGTGRYHQESECCVSDIRYGVCCAVTLTSYRSTELKKGHSLSARKASMRVLDRDRELARGLFYCVQSSASKVLVHWALLRDRFFWDKSDNT